MSRPVRVSRHSSWSPRVEAARPELALFMATGGSGERLERWLEDLRFAEEPVGSDTLGIAAGFVFGSLIQLSGSAADAPATDSADLHAWAKAYAPGTGCIGFDLTSGMLAAQGHLPLARGATPALAAPRTGSVEPCNSQMPFSMSVQRLP